MLNIPQDYEPYKLNCVAGDAVVGILCRRPDGGVSDWHATMNKKAVNGICPISGKPMKEIRTGVYVRKTGDITVVMTNAAATRAHFGGKSRKSITTIAPKKRTYMHRKPKATERKVSNSKFESDIDIVQAVNDAMKEAGL